MMIWDGFGSAGLQPERCQSGSSQSSEWRLPPLTTAVREVDRIGPIPGAVRPSLGDYKPPENPRQTDATLAIRPGADGEGRSWAKSRVRLDSVAVGRRCGAGTDLGSRAGWSGPPSSDRTRWTAVIGKRILDQLPSLDVQPLE